MFTAIGIYGPRMWLLGRIKKRQKLIWKSLPDAFDLITASVEAGLGIDAAFARVLDKVTGPFADELGRTMREISMGRQRRDALMDMAERTGVDEFRSLVNSIVQAEAMGISIGGVIRIQTGVIRTKRKQKAEEQAFKAPIKMVFPLVLFIFPTIMIVIGGPAIIKMINAGGIWRQALALRASAYTNGWERASPRASQPPGQAVAETLVRSAPHQQHNGDNARREHTVDECIGDCWPAGKEADQHDQLGIAHAKGRATAKQASGDQSERKEADRDTECQPAADQNRRHRAIGPRPGERQRGNNRGIADHVGDDAPLEIGAGRHEKGERKHRGQKRWPEAIVPRAEGERPSCAARQSQKRAQCQGFRPVAGFSRYSGFE